MENFILFFRSKYFGELIYNTVTISIYSLIAGFPIPIILAIMLNEASNTAFRKTVQMITYAPNFISMVVMVGMLNVFLSPSSGFVNAIIVKLGFEPIAFMDKPEYFKSLYVWSNIWQGAGWASIMYFAALSGIDTQLYEAAKIDGASKLQKILHIDLPGILPTIAILLIMQCGSIMSVGFEKIYLMQNALNTETSEVISTYVYKVGLLNAQYSYTSAVGLFNSVVNLILLIVVNKITSKLSGSGLW